MCATKAIGALKAFIETKGLWDDWEKFMDDLESINLEMALNEIKNDPKAKGH